MRILGLNGVSPGTRWVLAAIGIVCLLALLGLVSCRGDVTIMEVRTVNEGRSLDVILSTCNAHVTVDIDEYNDRVVLHAENHDRNWPFAGSDDCQDLVSVDLEHALGTRGVTDSSGAALIVIHE